MKKIIDNQPIILGLSGKAGSGKTSVAEAIVPKGSMETVKYGINWDHIFYALPLYEMASIKKNTVGFNEDSRKLYALHNVLYEVYGGSPIGNMPDYDVLVDKVRQINNLPIEKEGIKPRTFLQKAGDICREFDPNCFSNWAIIKANKLYKSYIKQQADDDNINPMCVIISDVRYLNEAKGILKQPNGFVISFDADEDVLKERLIKRDGKMMDQSQTEHSSELEAEQVKQIASTIINTNHMTLEEQVSATLTYLGIGINQHA